MDLWQGTDQFWSLYDRFCQEEQLVQHIAVGVTPLAHELRVITTEAARKRQLSRLCRPARGWQRHHAWVALDAATVFNHEGTLITHVRPGDVMTVQWNWDREILITHTPHREMVSGSLRGCLNERDVYGLFLPLFDRQTIETCIGQRLAADAVSTVDFFNKEAVERCWY